jgi:peptidoglycan/xylan/chitin deacetylase (PgdA/CDA1 family)
MLAFALAEGAQSPVVERRIAFSFDDAPREDGAFLSGAERGRRLIAGMQGADVRGAAFFVTTRNIDLNPDGEARLRAYADAGHVLGNHSHSHHGLSSSDPAVYLADVDVARQRLDALPASIALFRFPFLDEGRDLARRDAVRDGLAALGLGHGYVTIDTYDWYLESLVTEARRADPAVDMDMGALRKIYLDTLLASVEFYDGIARQHLGRSPAHVLLLHENDLAALFVDDLAEALRGKGWTIVPAIEAYQDPIATQLPDTLFNGQGRVAALAHSQGARPRNLVSEWEDEARLRALFVDAGLLAPAATVPQAAAQ